MNPTDQQTRPVYRPASVTDPAIWGPPVAVSTVTVVVARWWHDTGAAHSLGDAAGAGGVAGLAFGAGLTLVFSKPVRKKAGGRLRRLVEMCVGVAAGAAGVGIVGYADAPQPAVFTWIAGSVIGITVNGFRQRAERHRWENNAAQERREERNDATRIRLAEIRKEEVIGQARELGGAWAAQQIANNHRPVIQQIINTGPAGMPLAPPPHLAEIFGNGDRLLADVTPAAAILGAAGTDDRDEPDDDAAWLPDWINQGSTPQGQASA